MRRACALLVAAGALAACASPLEDGEALHRAGDPLAALETWRAIPPSSADHAAARRRTADLEGQLAPLAGRYRRRGAFFEERDRLAEAVLNFRLALKLAPDDRATLDHVQHLSRTLAERKRAHRVAFDEAFRGGNLARARGEMTALRTLDPFDPELSAREQTLDLAFDSEVTRRLEDGKRGFFAGSYGEAETAFRSVLEMDAGNESAQGYLAFIATLREAGLASRKPPAALRPPDFRASVAEIRAEGLYQNALSAERSGDPFAALRYDLAAVATNPAHRGAREHMGSLRRRLQSRVEELVESGLRAFVREDLETALDLWRRVLLIDPAHPRARDYADRAERMLANLERLRAEPQVGSGTP